MASRARGTSSSSIHLDIPRKSTELEDSGAHELSSDDEFQDASEERKRHSRPVTPSSPVPITRVEKVDDKPRHGEVPGTDAYKIRSQDAVPDEVEVVPEGRLSKRSSRQFLDTPRTPGGTPIPRTLVERIDPDTPSYGEDPGTPAFKTRMADAIPDMVLKNPQTASKTAGQSTSGHTRNTSNMSIPETIVTRVDDVPAHGEVPGTAAAAIRQQDASPDRMEVKREESARQPSSHFNTTPANPHNNNDYEDSDDDDEDEEGEEDDDDNDNDNENENNFNNNNDNDDFGDDFDDFEEGDQAMADDDFADFDTFEHATLSAPEAASSPGHSQPQPQSSQQQQQRQRQPSVPSFPILDFDALSTLPDLLEATRMHLDAMFPSTVHDTETTSSISDSIPADSPIFPSERSLSLWKQLITPPPLQPPNWTQSRIRRLFLISLGVPVDLDAILPPSKQKKLILPDIDLPSRNSLAADDQDSRAENENIAKLKNTKNNNSSTSVDSTQSAPAAGASKRGRERPKSVKPGPPPPPNLDLNAVKRICATTDEKINGFTDEELQAHIQDLRQLTEKTSQVLEYWLKRKDSLRKEKEAFEGVIENLVRHAKRVRTFK